MRDTFNAKTEDDRVSIQDGTFQQTNLPDGWADMVIIAQVSDLYASFTMYDPN